MRFAKSLKRDLVPKDWIRVEFYTHRVKALSCRGYWDFSRMSLVDSKIFQAIAARYRGHQPFLPNLRDLNWNGDETVYSYMSLFLNPQLTALQFCAPSYPNNPSPTLIESISTKCPHIRNLGVSFAYKAQRPDLFAPVSHLIGHIPVLEYLHCGFPLSPATIVHLSRLSTLTDMHLSDHPFAIIRSLVGEASVAPFSSLVNLAIAGWDGPSLIQLLRMMTLPQLKNLTIRLNHPSTFMEDQNASFLSVYHPAVFQEYLPSSVDDSDLMHIFHAICDSCSSGLPSFMIRLWPWRKHPPNSPPMIFRPLLRLTGLTFLNVHDVRGFEFDDATIREIASAWPSLQHLQTNNRHVVDSKVTLRGFSDLLEGCSQLNELWINISVFAVDVKVFRNARGIPNTSVKTLDLGYSRAEDDVLKTDMADIFALLCPCLTYFHVVPKDGSRDAWSMLE